MDCRPIANKIKRLPVAELEPFLDTLSLHCLSVLSQYRDTYVARVADEHYNKIVAGLDGTPCGV